MMDTVYFSGGEDRHEYGAWFHLHRDMVSAVIGCRPVSMRTDLNPPESSSFQYHHHTGLSNIWTS